MVFSFGKAYWIVDTRDRVAQRVGAESWCPDEKWTPLGGLPRLRFVKVAAGGAKEAFDEAAKEASKTDATA